MRPQHTAAIICAAVLLAACGAPKDASSSTESGPAAETGADHLANNVDVEACMAARVITLASDELEAEKACQLPEPNKLMVKLFDAGEPGCRPMIVAVAPTSDDTRRVQIVTSHGDDKQYRSGLSIQQRVLPDRRSGWVYLGGVMGAPDQSCSDLDFTVEEVRCIKGQNPATDYAPCEGIDVDASGLFGK